MPAAVNVENVDIPPNHDLSDIDKAYAAIISTRFVVGFEDFRNH
jgi:hypothetical protein